MKNNGNREMKKVESAVTNVVVSRAQSAAPNTFVGGGLGGVFGFLLFGPAGAALGAGLGAYLGSKADQSSKKG